MTGKVAGFWGAIALGLLVVCSAVLIGCAQAAEQNESDDAGSPVTVIKPAEGWDDLPVAKPGADDWPWWRGPGLNNIARGDKTPPLEWAPDKNILWRVKLDGKGHSTPCIWGKQIFLSVGDKKKKTISMICLDRDSGTEQWSTTVYSGELPRMHRDNSYASAMAACDGQRVFFAYQTPKTLRMVALSLGGKIIWDEEVAKYWTVQGHSASPALYKSLVIMPSDRKGAAALVAMHRKTGKKIWQVPRPGTKESYASPLVMRVAGRDQVVVIGPDNTRSYDPNTGKFLWECDGPAEYCAATVAFDKDKVYSTGGYPEKALLAINAGGKGNVTGKRVKWKSDRKAGYVPSPLVSDGLVYAVEDKGFMRCYNAESGKVVWEKHLQTKIYSSPVLVGKRIYLFDRKGKGFVMQAGGAFKLLAENTLEDGVFATPVISGGRIYLRTLGDLYCIGTK
ncbi:MAG: PQQ-binding-like beta-propeller repeat protein [Phycisphaerales bacterium]|jgi:outer membrane protein assembly factor BamB|nr:PQQ-binding-like beta-propeller repeat protein [Phycisphaerales bacterium]